MEPPLRRGCALSFDDGTVACGKTFLKLIINMIIINSMNLAGFDLNLLLVFDAVMRERHVTRAGERIGMSQPAVSNALNRLRHLLKDDVFLRGSDGMRPTYRALELAGPVRDALQNLETALDSSPFDPKTARRSFAVGTNDYALPTLMPELAARLEKEAPGITIRLVSSAGQTFDMLDMQSIDVGISAFSTIPERFGSAELIDDRYVLIMRKLHPLAQGDLSLADYAGARHLLVSPRGDSRGFVDDALDERGLERQIAMTVTSFSSAPGLLAASDLILAMPERIAKSVAPIYGLTMRPAPFPGPKAYSSAILVWHRRLADHPAHLWFRQVLQDLALDMVRREDAGSTDHPGWAI